MLTSGKLLGHLAEVEKATQKRMELLTRQMAKAQGMTEALKAVDQMKWVGRMNNIHSAAENHPGRTDLLLKLLIIRTE